MWKSNYLGLASPCQSEAAWQSFPCISCIAQPRDFLWWWKPAAEVIHPKRWFPRFQDSADNFEFSAERLSENAKSIKITLFAELLTAISPIYVQSLLNLSIKTLKHTICSTKMPHWHQILVIFMIYAILSRNSICLNLRAFGCKILVWKILPVYKK